jgi:PhzF family phenazine biosynthesis protein
VNLPIWVVDAFAEGEFAGNPAAVCLAEDFPAPRLMQAIACRNRLSETAFAVRDGADWRIRWFTPTAEVELCGHATLATAAVIFERTDEAGDTLRFSSRSGPLAVRREAADLVLDFPSRPPRAAPAALAAAQAAALGVTPASCQAAADNLFAVLSDEAAVRAVRPDEDAVAALSREAGVTGLIVTAPGATVDFVSRYFAPAVGVPEDPVTGSAHCTLVPYWAERLGRPDLVAWQLSERGGVLRCRARGERVDVGGRTRFYLEGRITV